MPRPKKYLDKSVLKAEYLAKHAEGVALWDGLPKQTARAIKNAALVASLRKSNPHRPAPSTAAAHELLKTRRESLRGVVVGLQIAAPADREEMVRWVRILERTPSRTPLSDRILEMALNLVKDNRKETRRNPKRAEWREYDRVELFESVLRETKCLRKSELEALILRFREIVYETPATID